MKTSVRRWLNVTLMVLSVMAVNSTGKPWRGLTPTHSTQLDAARVAQECANTKTRCTYRSKDSEVMIIFSGDSIGSGKCESLPTGTVLAIKVTFTRPQPFDDFKLNNKKVILFNPSTPPHPDYKGYYYPEEGFIISAFKGQVYGVVYIARQRDLRRCPEYYAYPKGFVETSFIY